MDRNDSIFIVKNLKSVWADNADKISVQYTGINSTHSEYILIN
jgi:hypothetical protein